MKPLPFFGGILALFAFSATAGTIEWNYLRTEDTGFRLANGRWKISAEVKMTYRNFLGVISDTEWQANLYINNIHNGGLLVGTGTQTFTTDIWTSRVEGLAGFDACYQGKAFAAAGGDVKQVGGNHVCTAPRPPSEPPPCDDDCQSPIVLSLHGGYHLTSSADGVLFDIDADGIKESVAWTPPNSEVGFLALDRNRNGTIESGAELFGDSTTLSDGNLAANGFEALAELDSNRDGEIDANDPAWQNLLLWTDMSHDGSSQASELVPIRNSDVLAISTHYKPSGKKDRFGNEFRYAGEFRTPNAWRKCYDVFLVTAN